MLNHVNWTKSNTISINPFDKVIYDDKKEAKLDFSSQVDANERINFFIEKAKKNKTISKNNLDNLIHKLKDEKNFFFYFLKLFQKIFFELDLAEMNKTTSYISKLESESTNEITEHIFSKLDSEHTNKTISYSSPFANEKNTYIVFSNENKENPLVIYYAKTLGLFLKNIADFKYEYRKKINMFLLMHRFCFDTKEETEELKKIKLQEKDFITFVVDKTSYNKRNYEKFGAYSTVSRSYNFQSGNLFKNFFNKHEILKYIFESVDQLDKESIDIATLSEWMISEKFKTYVDKAKSLFGYYGEIGKQLKNLTEQVDNYSVHDKFSIYKPLFNILSQLILDKKKYIEVVESLFKDRKLLFENNHFIPKDWIEKNQTLADFFQQKGFINAVESQKTWCELLASCCSFSSDKSNDIKPPYEDRILDQDYFFLKIQVKPESTGSSSNKEWNYFSNCFPKTKVKPIIDLTIQEIDTKNIKMMVKRIYDNGNFFENFEEYLTNLKYKTSDPFYIIYMFQKIVDIFSENKTEINDELIEFVFKHMKELIEEEKANQIYDHEKKNHIFFLVKCLSFWFGEVHYTNFCNDLNINPETYFGKKKLDKTIINLRDAVIQFIFKNKEEILNSKKSHFDILDELLDENLLKQIDQLDNIQKITSELFQHIKSSVTLFKNLSDQKHLDLFEFNSNNEEEFKHAQTLANNISKEFALFSKTDPGSFLKNISYTPIYKKMINDSPMSQKNLKFFLSSFGIDLSEKRFDYNNFIEIDYGYVEDSYDGEKYVNNKI